MRAREQSVKGAGPSIKGWIGDFEVTWKPIGVGQGYVSFVKIEFEDGSKPLKVVLKVPTATRWTACTRRTRDLRVLLNLKFELQHTISVSVINAMSFIIASTYFQNFYIWQ
ncbi:hypothetical protein L596_014781 [Steinernema carpocapsae]|uniref:Uncharacterized protein n=1 Tax=Steinernema carpocapsae TaxID=34508 RepID=A0A4U5NCW4_STECR|nr:hypothetical protein L596_014781 [Steinernema carpocapsae]